MLDGCIEVVSEKVLERNHDCRLDNVFKYQGTAKSVPIVAGIHIAGDLRGLGILLKQDDPNRSIHI